MTPKSGDHRALFGEVFVFLRIFLPVEQKVFAAETPREWVDIFPVVSDDTGAVLTPVVEVGRCPTRMMVSLQQRTPDDW